MNNMLFDCTAYESPRGETLFMVTMQDDGGEIVRRELEISSFMHLLDATKVMDENYIHVSRDLIPDGYIDGCFASEQTYRCVWEVKGRKRQFVLDMRNGEENPLRHFEVPFPDLVFAVTVSKGVRQSFSVYAKKEGSTALCRYPFGNVSLDGSVCMGNIRQKEFTPSSIEEDFFLGVTNNDYYTGISKCGMDWSQERLVKELQGKDKFPDNWLVETDTTLEELLKKYAA